MRPQTTPLIALALVAVLCGGETTATVVQGGAISNKPVEVGGVRVPPQPPPPVQYSLIGAIASGGDWFTQCASWSLRFLGSLADPHPARTERNAGREFDNRRLEWVPPPMP
jgi:hypothetical protein